MAPSRTNLHHFDSMPTMPYQLGLCRFIMQRTIQPCYGYSLLTLFLYVTRHDTSFFKFYYSWGVFSSHCCWGAAWTYGSHANRIAYPAESSFLIRVCQAWYSSVTSLTWRDVLEQFNSNKDPSSVLLSHFDWQSWVNSYSYLTLLPRTDASWSIPRSSAFVGSSSRFMRFLSPKAMSYW